MSAGGRRGWSIMGGQRLFADVMQVVVGLGVLSLSLGALGLGDMGERSPGETPTDAGQLNFHQGAELVLRASSTGGIAWLLRGVALVSVVWMAEVLSGSKGLVTSVLRTPCLGLLIGLGLGAADGLRRTVEVLGPGAWLRVLGNGIGGAGVGASVAAESAVAIGGLLSLVAIRAAKNVAIGGEIRPAPLVVVLVVAGAARTALSLAPGCMAAGALAGSVLGTGRDGHALTALLVLGSGWWAGWRWLGGGGALELTTGAEAGRLSARRVVGGVTGLSLSVFGALCLGLPLQIYPVLVSVLLGTPIALLSLTGGEAVCRTLAESVDRLFVAISINTYHGQEERLIDTFGWENGPLHA
ncbi:hypothetical protein DPEC_G00275040 [Dallia pectoralis]|uniref:Uncharacterized protein n=1 Tax=Dallia pectoralis TaxID=75939 RepID=A0ACC2FL38_DALPE|nr:hypothetical protein DPEC_G00275040 [Dallia pectoralis]